MPAPDRCGRFASDDATTAATTLALSGGAMTDEGADGTAPFLLWYELRAPRGLGG